MITNGILSLIAAFICSSKLLFDLSYHYDCKNLNRFTVPIIFLFFVISSIINSDVTLSFLAS